MADLTFEVIASEVITFAIEPTIRLKLRVKNVNQDRPVKAGLLRCQIRIERTKRSYQPDEKDELSDLFGTADRWG